MNIALILQNKLLLGIQRLLSGAPSSAAKASYWSPEHALLPVQASCNAITRSGEIRVTPATGATVKKVMPLRVLRVLEKGQPRSCAGRLVISGRMADVCAELDRLVAREAALH
jgi:hypothetical protein